MLDAVTVAKITAIISALGLFLPALQALIQRPLWTSKTKSLLTVGLSVIGGLVAYVATNGLSWSTPAELLSWIVGVYLATVTFYHGLLKPTGVAGGIEEGTSPTVPFDEDEVEVDPADIEDDDLGPEVPMPDGFDDGSGTGGGLDIAKR